MTAGVLVGGTAPTVAQERAVAVKPPPVETKRFDLAEGLYNNPYH